MNPSIKILQVTLGPWGWRNPAAVSCLDAVCAYLLKQAVKNACQLVILPGGFWTVRRKRELRLRAAAIGRMAAHAGVAILAGIDLRRFSKLEVTPEVVRQGRIPGFAVAVDASGHWAIGRQRSTRGAHSSVKVPKIKWSARSATIQGRTITYLLCGELYNLVLRSELARRNPAGIAVLGHWNMPRRAPSARLLSQAAGCPVWISQRLEHTRSMPGYAGASDQTVYAPPEPTSTPVAHGPWVAWTIRTV